MRFRFPDERNLRENTARAALRRRIDDWWLAFTREAPRLEAHFSKGENLDVPGFMGVHFQPLDARLMWEFGPPLAEGRHRLVITPEGQQFLRPLVDELLARAPKGTGFEFHSHRPAVPLESAKAIVKGRTGLGLEGWSVYATPNDAFGVDLTFLAPLGVASSEKARHAALVAAEVLLGEGVFDASIDAVEVSAGSMSGEVPVKLESLAAEVHALLEKKRSELPAVESFESREDKKGWVLEREPDEAPEYPRQTDLYVATTSFLAPSARVQSGRPFSSQRFSRDGVTFCYVKLDGIEGLGPEGFQDRGDIQEALDLALIEPKLGATIGGGTGLLYSYVELALRDVEKALPTIIQTLRAGHVPKRTWLLFHDSSLHAEWVGIWDDTPAPPLLPE
jgi:hypothetical protein